ncbi:MAG: hypothetical protein ACFB0C_15545 [Leptolyngbyaceae cyanobacterium]|mgnify:FL=1
MKRIIRWWRRLNWSLWHVCQGDWLVWDESGWWWSAAQPRHQAPWDDFLELQRYELAGYDGSNWIDEDDCSDDWLEPEDDYFECGLMDDGYCLLVGSEECDWDCNYRDLIGVPAGERGEELW